VRDVDRLPPRVQGREQLERRIRVLLIHAGRFSQHRAKSASDALWAARVVDALQELLDVRAPNEAPGWQSRSTWESE
jgi:hypothetical protein